MFRLVASLVMLNIFSSSVAAQSVTDLHLNQVSEDKAWGQISTWSEAKLPRPDIASGAMVYHENKIYLLGGHLGDQHRYKAENFTDECWVLDLKAQPIEWKSLPKKPVASVSPGASIFKDAIYLVGGFMLDENKKFASNSKIEKFDLKTQTWSVLDKQLPPRSSGAFVGQNGKIYLLGGWDAAKDKYFTNVMLLDLETLELTEHPASLPSPARRAVSSLLIEDSILIAGGLIADEKSPARGNRVVDRLTVFHPNAEDGKYWEEIGVLPFAATNPNVGFWKGQLYVFGGYEGDVKNFGIAQVFNADVHTRALRGEKWEKTGLTISEKRAFSRILPMGEMGIAVIGGYIQNDKEDPFVPKTPGASAIPTVDFFQPKAESKSE